MMGRITFVVLCFVGVIVFVSQTNILATKAAPTSKVVADTTAVASDMDEPGIPDNATRLAMVEETIKQLPNGGEGTTFCFSPDIDPTYYQTFCEMHPNLCGMSADPRYFANCRWFNVAQGTPVALTWSLVPDSTPGANSNLFSGMNAKFGNNQNLWISLLQQCFDRWQALSGVTYTRVTVGGNPWDDGGSWGAGGAAGLRGDIRIRMVTVDGENGVLAYDNYPCDGGDMSLDKDEQWQQSSANYRFLRDVVMHEHGHGLGLGHVCPVIFSASGTLMNPFINTNFDGPQHDDIRGVQFEYGDKRENNDSAATATNLGTLVTGSPVTVGAIATPPAIAFPSSLVSIDSASNDQDWYKFVVTGPSIANVTVRPRGTTYQSAPQSCSGGQGIDCCDDAATYNLDSKSQINLGFEIRGGTNGTNVIYTANTAGMGADEVATNVALTGSPGTFYVRVFGAGSNTQVQLYLLDISVTDTTLDVSAPAPAPGFAQLMPVSENSIYMQSTTASDPAGVQYFFHFVSGAAGGADSGWQADTEYTNTGLAPNRSFSYQVKARDFAPPPGPNETAYSAVNTTASMIQTPGTFTVGTVTQNSIQITADGAFSFLTTPTSGLFFEQTPAAGSGANVWVTTTTINVTGLAPGTMYSFRAKARNRVSIETGFSQPINVTTLPAAGTGACCMANGTCQLLSSGSCLANSGTYHGDASVCSPNPCPPPTGACCQGVSCSVVTESSCNSLGGTYEGNFTVCSPNPCGVVTGACCHDDGSCIVETEAACNSNSGDYHGDGSVCSPNPCPQPCTLLGDINGDSVVDGQDIAGYVRVKMGTPDGGDNASCADYGNGNLDDDTNDFINDLVN